MRSGQFYAQPSGQAVGRSAGAEKRRRRRKSETKEDDECGRVQGERDRKKEERRRDERKKKRMTKRIERRQEEAFCNCAKGAHTHTRAQATLVGPEDGGMDTGGGFKCVTKEVNL